MIEELLTDYGGWLMLLFATGYGIGFLITMARRFFEKI